MKNISKTAHELFGQFLGNTEETKHRYSDGNKIMATNGSVLACNFRRGDRSVFSTDRRNSAKQKTPHPYFLRTRRKVLQCEDQ